MSRTLSRRGGAAAAGLALALSLAGVASAAPTTTYVLPQDLGATTPVGAPCAPNPAKWCTQTRGGGVINVAPSEMPKSGPGSLYLSTPDTNPAVSDKANTLNSALAGQALSTLTTLAYESYVITPGTANAQQAPAINIQVDTNGTTAPGGFATLVWEPLYSAQNGDGVAVTPEVWQSWTPSSKSGWWSPANKDPNDLTGRAEAPAGTVGTLGFRQYTATFAEVKAALPSSTVIGRVGVNQGGGNPGLSSNVDLLQVNNTVYDFELDANHDGIPDTLAPTNKDQCKDDGWKAFNNPTFKNQGDCVSYVARS